MENKACIVDLHIQDGDLHISFLEDSYYDNTKTSSDGKIPCKSPQLLQSPFWRPVHPLDHCFPATQARIAPA